MSASISYSKYPTDGQLTYNGGAFMGNTQASIAGCAGTSCKTLAANSVFTDPINQGETLAPASSCGLSGGAKKRKRSYKKRATRKHSSKKHMKGGKRMSRKSRKHTKRRRHSTKKHMKRSRRNRSRKHSSNRKHKRYTMKGGSKNPNQQLMSNICHSAGYSIGDKNTELKPTEVGLAAGHFAPYTKSQNN
jgi:hypothetical protein